MVGRLGTVQVAAAAVTAVGALYFVLVVVGNTTDFDTNRMFVERVLAMDTTFQDPDVMWRAVTSPAAVTAAYLGIILWEVVTATVLLTATALWARALARGSDTVPARRWSTLGWTMSMLLFGGGFIVVGGEWFQMWQSSEWNGLQPAAQNFLIAAVGVALANFPVAPGEQ